MKCQTPPENTTRSTERLVISGGTQTGQDTCVSWFRVSDHVITPGFMHKGHAVDLEETEGRREGGRGPEVVICMQSDMY